MSSYDDKSAKGLASGDAHGARDREHVSEPRLQPVPTGREKRINDVIERAASRVTSLVAVMLMMLVMIAIIGVVAVSWNPLVHQHDFVGAAVAGLDAVFVAIILLELVHTTLSRGPISSQIQEFLVIGITSAIRCGLESAADRDRNPRETAVVLAITAGASLLLVVALWLLRQRLHAERKLEPQSTDTTPRAKGA